MKTDIRSSWVDWRTTQSRILTLGHGVEDSLGTLDGQNLIVVIPGVFQESSQSSVESPLAGNPGLGTMYQDFMKVLSECLDDESLSIWSFSYVGHDTQTPPTLPTGQAESDSMSHCLGWIKPKWSIIFQLPPTTWKTK